MHIRDLRFELNLGGGSHAWVVVFNHEPGDEMKDLTRLKIAAGQSED